MEIVVGKEGNGPRTPSPAANPPAPCTAVTRRHGGGHCTARRPLGGEVAQYSLIGLAGALKRSEAGLQLRGPVGNRRLAGSAGRTLQCREELLRRRRGMRRLRLLGGRRGGLGGNTASSSTGYRHASGRTGTLLLLRGPGVLCCLPRGLCRDSRRLLLALARRA